MVCRNQCPAGRQQGRGVASGDVAAQRHDRQQADRTDDEDRGLERAGGDESDGGHGAEAADDRIQRDSRADAGDSAHEVEETGEDDALVASVTENPVGVIDQRRLEGKGRDRRRERHEVEHAGGQCELAGVRGFHVIPLRVGAGSRTSAGRRGRAASGASRAVRPGPRSGPG